MQLVWILALSLYGVFGVILVLALCKTAAASDASEEKTCEAMQIASRWAPRPNRLDLNLADFEPQFLDVHILSSDVIVVHVDDEVAPEVREPACA